MPRPRPSRMPFRMSRIFWGRIGPPGITAASRMRMFVDFSSWATSVSLWRDSRLLSTLLAASSSRFRVS